MNDSLETLQQQLAAASADYRRQLDQQKRAPADLQRVLPEDAVLVDILEYNRYQPPKEKGGNSTWEPRLTAFVIRPHQPIDWIDLGPSKPIADAVDRWRKSYSTADGTEVRRLAWQPLEAKLAGAKIVLLSPDGALDRFPLAALPGKKEGTYLVEEMAIATIPIPRMLPELMSSSQSNSAGPSPNGNGAAPSLLTVGDVDFKAPLTTAAPAEQLAMSAPRERGANAWQFPPLEGTRAEVAAINDNFCPQLSRWPASIAVQGPGH